MTGSFLDERAALAGLRAVVVGGGYGVGAAVTLALAGAGVHVAVCDNDDEALDTIVPEAEALGVQTFAMHVDVTVPEELDAFYAEVGDWSTTIDIVVNVAGGVRRRKFMDGSRDEDARDIRLNYGYILDSVRSAVPLIRATGRGGSIINFTTIEAHRGAATLSVYAGAKAATSNFTRAMANELGVDRIRVNCIAPDMTPSRTSYNAAGPAVREPVLALPQHVRDIRRDMYIPLKKVPDEASLANAVLYLGSDLAAFVTGITLHVDGGTSASLGFIDWPFGDGHMPSPLAGTLSKFV